MQEDQAEIGRAGDAGRVHERPLLQREDLGPDDSRDPGPAEETQDHDDRPYARMEDRIQDQDDRQEREDEEDVRGSHQERVDDPTVVARDEPDNRADSDPEQGGQQSDNERNLGAVEDQGQHVVADEVGAEDVPVSGRVHARRQRSARGAEELEHDRFPRHRVGVGAVHLLRRQRGAIQGAAKRPGVHDVGHRRRRDDSEQRRDDPRPGLEGCRHGPDLVVGGVHVNAGAGVDLVIVEKPAVERQLELTNHRARRVEPDEERRVVGGLIEPRVYGRGPCAHRQADRLPARVGKGVLPSGNEREPFKVEVRDSGMRGGHERQVELHREQRPGESDLPPDRRRFSRQRQGDPGPVHSRDIQDLQRVVGERQQHRRTRSGTELFECVHLRLVVVDKRRRTQAHVLLKRQVPEGLHGVTLVDVRDLVHRRVVEIGCVEVSIRAVGETCDPDAYSLLERLHEHVPGRGGVLAGVHRVEAQSIAENCGLQEGIHDREVSPGEEREGAVLGPGTERTGCAALGNVPSGDDVVHGRQGRIQQRIEGKVRVDVQPNGLVAGTVRAFVHVQCVSEHVHSDESGARMVDLPHAARPIARQRRGRTHHRHAIRRACGERGQREIVRVHEETILRGGLKGLRVRRNPRSKDCHDREYEDDRQAGHPETTLMQAVPGALEQHAQLLQNHGTREARRHLDLRCGHADRALRTRCRRQCCPRLRRRRSGIESPPRACCRP